MSYDSFLHTMIRVSNLENSINFYTNILGLKLLRKKEYPEGKFTLAFMGLDIESRATVLELTYNWDKEDSYDIGNGFGHLAFSCKDLNKCYAKLEQRRVKILRPPGPMKYDSDDYIAFIEDPDGYKIELIEKK